MANTKSMTKVSKPAAKEASVAEQVTAKLSAEAEKAKAAVEDVTAVATEQAKAAADSLTAAVENVDLKATLEDATQFVKRNPGVCMLAALAAGIAIGAASSKRNY